MTNTESMITVEVAYALPDRQAIVEVAVPEGTSLREAVKRSSIHEHFPEVDMDSADLGIFGKLERNPEQRVVRSGERIEIYRELLVDPKESRRRRAEKAKAEKSKDKSPDR